MTHGVLRPESLRAETPGIGLTLGTSESTVGERRGRTRRRGNA